MASAEPFKLTRCHVQQPFLPSPVEVGRKAPGQYFSEALQVAEFAKRGLDGLCHFALAHFLTALWQADRGERLAHVAVAFGGYPQAMEATAAGHIFHTVAYKAPFPSLQAMRSIVDEQFLPSPCDRRRVRRPPWPAVDPLTEFCDETIASLRTHRGGDPAAGQSGFRGQPLALLDGDGFPPLRFRIGDGYIIVACRPERGIEPANFRLELRPDRIPRHTGKEFLRGAQFCQGDPGLMNGDRIAAARCGVVLSNGGQALPCHMLEGALAIQAGLR